MRVAKEQPANLESFITTSVQRLQRRIMFLLGTLVLFIAVGLSYLVYVINPNFWLLATAGIIIMSIALLWATNYMLKQHMIRPFQSFQSEPDRFEQSDPLPSSRPAVDYEPAPAIPDTPPHNVEAQPQSETDTEFRRLVESYPHSMIIHNQSQIVFTNEAGAQLLGAAGPEKIVGQAMTAFAHPDYRAALEARLQQIGQRPIEITTSEEKLTTPQGTDIDVEMVMSPIVYQNSPMAQLTLRDITEEKRSQNELVQRNRELTVLQSAGVAITSRLDLRYVLDTVSEEMTKLPGIESCTIYEWEEAENQIIQIAHFGPAGWWDPKASVVKHNMANYPLTKSVLEEQIPQQMTISQATIDPSEAAHMQQTHVKTRMILPMVFQQRVIGLVALEDSRVERKFSYQQISLIKLLANQAASAVENAKLFYQAQQEISDRKRAEAELEDERAMLAERVQERTAELSKVNAELARAARLKDEFLAGMSHELRTPLNAILGSAEILQTEVFGPVNERQLKYLRNTEESGQHLLSLINDILDLSKIEAGKLEVDIGPVSVKSVCESSLRLVKQLAHKKQLKVSEAIDEQPTVIQADERRLKQILVNLLSNAIKFTPSEGKIGLEVKGDSVQEIVQFTVWDTGIGITKEDMGRLFQPFVQLDSSLAREFVGTGLGLSLVSRMTELHGGGVAAESEVGQGSRFTVSLPWPQAAEAEAAVEQEPDIAISLPLNSRPGKSSIQSPLILLAEDNEDNINTILEFLEIQGYRINIARNGNEAVERAKEEKPHVILMDVQMPGMDGLTAARHLRADAELAEVPIIALTALAMPGDRERSLEAGVNDYLSKPVSPRRLVQTINKYLNNLQ